MEITFLYKAKTVTSYWWYMLNILFSIKTEIICRFELKINVAHKATVPLEVYKGSTQLYKLRNTVHSQHVIMELTDLFLTVPIFNSVCSILLWEQAMSICLWYLSVHVSINEYDIISTLETQLKPRYNITIETPFQPTLFYYDGLNGIMVYFI
jgi:hypothetical protein